jgi:hypothetical protein
MNHHSYSEHKIQLLYKICLLILLFLLNEFSQAQEQLVIDSVGWFDKGDANVVYKNGRIAGYAFTYQISKPSKQDNRCITNIYDSSLHEIAKITLILTKKEQLLESLYLDNQLICILYNDRLQSIITRVYDNTGIIIKEYTRELDNNSEYYFKKHPASGSTTGQKNEYIYPIGETGFFTLFPLKHNTIFSYEISIYQNGKSAVTYIPKEDTKQEKPEFIGATDSLLLFHVMSKKVLVNNKYDSWLLSITINNGTKRFMNSTLLGKHPYYPTNMASQVADNNFTILGSYFKPDSKIQKTNTSGICTIRFNSNGDELQRAYQSWEEEIGRHITIVDTGGTNDFGNLYIQQIIPIRDKYIVVGEGYKKRGNDGAVALGILSALIGASTGILTNGLSVYPVWGYDYTDFTLTDLAILQMDSTFAINDVHTFSKESHKTLTYGNDVINKTKIEARRFLSQAFDYDYIQPGNDSTAFIVGYRQYSKVNKDNFFDYRIIENSAGQYYIHNIQLSSVANSVWGMPAKQGFTLIAEYFIKEKKVKLHLAKIE